MSILLAAYNVLKEAQGAGQSPDPDMDMDLDANDPTF